MTRVKSYPRNCFVCGEKMTSCEDGLMLECKWCDVMEDATVTGRFTYITPTAIDWCHRLITLIDHGKEHVPSPG